MKIILLSDVPKLGRRHDVKDVNSGHATNFLIPRKLAIVATKQALKSLAVNKAKTEGERKVQEELLAKNLSSLDGKEVSITEKANEKGHLFAGLHKDQIAKIISEQTRVNIDPAFVELDQPIKEEGEHSISIKVGEKKATVKFTINK